jgi:hypothetical protein
MKQRSSREANRSPASQGIPRISLNPKIHHRIHKHPTPFPILRQINPVQVWNVLKHRDFLLRETVSTSPNSQAANHPFSAVFNCLFNSSAATLHTGGRSPIRNLRSRHAVMTGKHMSHGQSSTHTYITSRLENGCLELDVTSKMF